MIITFSVPERHSDIIDWYQNLEKSERSREFRRIILSYLNNGGHILEVNEETYRDNNIDSDLVLKRVKVSNSDSVKVNDDLDSKLDSLGVMI